jgi:tRNA modification GTPase
LGKGSFAQLTPPGEGGIAVFGLAGRGVRGALSAAVDSERLAALEPGELAYGRLRAADGTVLDEVIVACLPPEGRDERFELNCHAGGAAAAAAAERLVELGLVRGELPPERNLSGLEAGFRGALPAVRTRRQLAALAAARRELPGALREIAGSLAAPSGARRAAERLEEVLAESARLAGLLAVHRAVLAGPANAGKSTLFNRLAGADRAIASPHPGTTRDAVEASAALRGLAVELTDTAGLGAGRLGELARRSEEMTRGRAAGAGLLLLVLDGSRALEAEGRKLAGELSRAAPRTIAVLNKADLGTVVTAGDLAELGAGPVRSVSALDGRGVPELLAELETALLPEPPRGGAAAPGRELRSNLAQAYTCAKRAAVENDRAAASEAAGILSSVLEAPA